MNRQNNSLVSIYRLLLDRRAKRLDGQQAKITAGVKQSAYPAAPKSQKRGEK